MQKLRISSNIELHHYPKSDISEYIRQGLIFHKKVGFNGLFNYEVLANRLPAALRESFARYLVQCAGEMMKH